MSMTRQDLYFTKLDKNRGASILTTGGKLIVPDKIYFDNKGYVVEKGKGNCVPKPEWIDTVISVAMNQINIKRFKTFVFCVIFYEDDPFGISIVGDVGNLSIFC
jgi:hypothetical protein